MTVGLLALPVLAINRGISDGARTTATADRMADAGDTDPISAHQEAAVSNQAPIASKASGTQDRPVFEAADLPEGFRLAETSDGPPVVGGTDRHYRAYIRGTDPDTSENWAVVRVRIRYESGFDADAWLAAWLEFKSDEGDGPLMPARAPQKITIRGTSNALAELPTEPGITVIRWLEQPGIQIIVTGSGVTYEELLSIAEGLKEVQP